MKRMVTGVEDLLTEQLVEQAQDSANRQADEQREMIEKEVYDVDFRLKFDKSNLLLVGVMWLIFIIIFVKAMGKDMFRAYQAGALLHISFYSTWKIVMMAIVLVAVIFGSVFYLFCGVKPMPRIRNSCMYYRGKRYHFSEITKLVMMRRVNLAKVYVNGKYKFWISPDYINYRSFIEWAQKCKIPIQGETTIRKINIDVEANQKKVLVITIVVAMIMVAIAVVMPIMVMTNH